MNPARLFGHCAWAVFTIAFVAACGGSASNAPGVAGAQTGAVGLIVTDNPTEDFDEILVTFSCARLLGDDGQVTIFEGEETFDLLSLRDVTELFAVNDSVPVGTYSKIRLCVDDVELVSRDEYGDASQQVRKLLGNGKLDLSPRGDFYLGPEQTVLVQLDWDAEKSVKFNGNGPDNVSLRPVVFLDIIGVDLPELGKLLRLHGVIRDLDREERNFELCQTHFLRDADDDEDDVDDIRDGCVEVVLEDDASIFDSNGDAVTVDDVENGDEATVFGRVLRAVPLDDDDCAVVWASGHANCNRCAHRRVRQVLLHPFPSPGMDHLSSSSCRHRRCRLHWYIVRANVLYRPSVRSVAKGESGDLCGDRALT